MAQQIPSTISSEPLGTTTRRRRHSWSILVVTTAGGDNDGDGSNFMKYKSSIIHHRKTISFDTTPLLRYHLAHQCLDPAIASNNSSNNPCLTKPECFQQNAMATRSSMSPSFASFPPNNNNIGNQAVDHYSIDITRRIPQRAIRVERDYTRGDGITQFSTAYPPQLAGKITIEQFQHTIQGINKLLMDAERVSWLTVFDNIMEILTIYTWPIFFSNHYQRCIRRVLQFIESENENLYHQHGLSISNPVRFAFLFLEFKVYDD
ncbi:hypothetical protein O0I10_011507 [Lichtheimia ornata]|uniref:Ras modification protein ERF4 n=1 Tax=Lichtheimia ornata TaxID=688661 RepID=A0AAD7USR9_9FUNG|nr:uncharacterized protein O0I10_011507 [Lichtheimia ornata]KAJ8652833.1 hypothetical protein O0I10_011507 [Lichtheimia ornata]